MNDYQKFSKLHASGGLVVIANAWNVKSARLIEKTGYDAIATSSGAIADSLGYKDGEKIPFEEVLYIVGRIKNSVNIPVSVDMERGYAPSLSKFIENVQQLIGLGVVGINLEDENDQEKFLPKISALRNYLDRTGQHLFINARTDAFLGKHPFPLETAVRRASIYKDAGADGIFVPGLSDPETITAIVSSTTLPVNIICSENTSSIQMLSECGVKRITMAGFLYRSVYRHLERTLTKMQITKSLMPMFESE